MRPHKRSNPITAVDSHGVQNVLSRHEDTLRRVSDALNRIGKGQLPTVAAEPIGTPDLSSYFYLPGRSGGQTAYGGTAAADTLKLWASAGSTTAAVWINNAVAIKQRGVGGVDDLASPDFIMNPSNPAASAGSFRFVHPNPANAYFEVAPAVGSVLVGVGNAANGVMVLSAGGHSTLGKVTLTVGNNPGLTLVQAATASGDLVRCLDSNLNVNSRITYQGKFAIFSPVVADHACTIGSAGRSSGAIQHGLALRSDTTFATNNVPLRVITPGGTTLAYIDYAGTWIGPISPTGGNWTNVAYLNAAQTFTKAQTIEPDSDTTGLNIKGTNLSAQNFFTCTDVGSSTVISLDPQGFFNACGMAIWKGYVGSSEGVAFDPTPISTGNFRTYYLPDADGTLVLTAGTQSLTGKTLGTSCVLNTTVAARCNTASSGFVLTDNGTNAKALRYVLSGLASANHSLTFVSDAARDWSFPNQAGRVVIGGFALTTSDTCANTTSETTLSDAGGQGSLTINAAPTGRSVRITASGVASSTNAAPTLRVKIKHGSTTVVDTGTSPSFAYTNTNTQWHLDLILTWRSATTVIGQGTFRFFDGGAGSGAMSEWPLGTGTSTVTVSASGDISMTVQWGTAHADNTITCTNFNVETIY